MKKFLLSIIFIFISLCGYSIHVNGEYVKMSNKLVGNFWFPCCTFHKIDDHIIFSICLTASDGYFDIPNDGKLLIKLNNDSIIKLTKIEFSNIIKNEGNYKITDFKYQKYYQTIIYYDCDDFNELILKNYISKIRVQLTNGNMYDFEVPQKYTKKLNTYLSNVRKNLDILYEQRKNNINGGFEDNF